jgi:hypothetical protein
MLTIYRRHLKRCKNRAHGRKHRHCQCPIWVDGLLAGQEIRESLKMRDWQRAQKLVREWETEGHRSGQQETDPLTVKEACEKFIADSEARGLRATTLYKYRLLFRQLQEFARENACASSPSATSTSSAVSDPPGPTGTLRLARSWSPFEPSADSLTTVVGSQRIPARS